MNSVFTYFIIIAVVTALSSFIVLFWWLRSKDRHITRDIIENVNETIVIFDRQGDPSYVNIVPDRDNNDEFLNSIEKEILHSGVLPLDYTIRCLQDNGSTVYEGVLKPYKAYDSVYSWKMRPVLRNMRYFGCIYVFSDITQYTKLHEQIEKQNIELKDAYEKQRQYVEVAKKLSVEEERERIMCIVNDISAAYRKQLDESIKKMELYVAGTEPEDIIAYETENGRMIQVTRDTIAKIRSTVRELHNSV